MICGMVIIVPLSLRVLDIGIAIVPCVDFEPALVTGVDDAHCHGYVGWGSWSWLFARLSNLHAAGEIFLHQLQEEVGQGITDRDDVIGAAATGVGGEVAVCVDMPNGGCVEDHTTSVTIAVALQIVAAALE